MPWSRVVSFTDPFPYQAAIRAADIELYPTARGQFHAELTQINLSKLWMQRLNENLPLIYASKLQPGRRAIGFLTSDQQPGKQHCGVEVSPRDIVVSKYDSMHHRTRGDSRYGTMSLTTDDFDAACKAIIGQELSGLPLKHIVRPAPYLMARLVNLHNVADHISRTKPDLLGLTEVTRSLEQNLVHVMVRCLADGADLGMTAGGRRHDAIVARFEAFLEAHADAPLYLAEICAAIEVSERGLRIACEEHLGMGPIRYLALRRMHLVRRALLRADPAKATVTQLATDHGFWELGRFAGGYKALFGESPSETLRRPAESRPVLLNRPSSLSSPALQR